MQGLLAKLNQKNPTLSSRGASRSGSIASSVDEQNEDEHQSSDESQSQQTFKPKVKGDKKYDRKASSWNSTGQKEPAKPKAIKRIDTGMVKLKLLDATRKAIMEKANSKRQLVSSYTQTDAYKTRLCKDQSVENQIDLINPVDQSTETEVELVAMRTRDGTLIITSTCASNTEIIPQESVSTQTVMPRSNVGFKTFVGSKHKVQYAEEDEFSNDEEISDATTQELVNIEKRLKSRQKQKLTRQRSQKANADFEDEAAAAIPSVTVSREVNQNNSDSEYEDSIHEGDHRANVAKVSTKRSSQNDATFNSWHDLDFQNSDDKVVLPRSYFTDGPTPWSNFQDLVLGQRFLNARLSPTPQRQPRPNLKHVTWSDDQIKIVRSLINESNALLEMFDNVAMLLGPDIKLSNVSDVEKFELPPSKYSNEMTKSCDKLEASLKRLQDIKND